MASSGAAAADYVTGLEISYGSALLPKMSKYNKNGVAVDLAPPGAATSSYLWFSRSVDEPVVDVVVLYDAEPTPEGYTKAARDLSAGSSAPVFLAYRKVPSLAAGMRPVVAIHTLAEGEAPAGASIAECVKRPKCDCASGAAVPCTLSCCPS